jgi:hypothetical protein
MTLIALGQTATRSSRGDNSRLASSAKKYAAATIKIGV